MNKKFTAKQAKILLCILKNQIAIMEAVKMLFPYEHFAIYGDEYTDKLEKRIKSSKNIL